MPQPCHTRLYEVELLHKSYYGTSNMYPEMSKESNGLIYCYQWLDFSMRKFDNLQVFALNRDRHMISISDPSRSWHKPTVCNYISTRWDTISWRRAHGWLNHMHVPVSMIRMINNIQSTGHITISFVRRFIKHALQITLCSSPYTRCFSDLLHKLDKVLSCAILSSHAENGALSTWNKW